MAPQEAEEIKHLVLLTKNYWNLLVKERFKLPTKKRGYLHKVLPVTI